MIDLIRVPDPTCIDDLLDEPLGLLYLGASLDERGHDVRITNLAGHDVDSWKPEIKEADLYGIQLYTPTAHIGIDIAKFIKEKFDKPVICGGAHPTALPELEDLSVFDKVVLSEGERSIVGIAEAHKKGRNLPRVVKSEFIEDLDSVPFPARGMVDMMSFHRKLEGERSFGIIGSRGCNYKCAFCDRSLFGSRARFRSIGNIVDEIKEVVSEYDVRNFEFFDDMFGATKKRIREFAEKTRGLNIKYRCNGRSDVLDKEVYESLHDSGCRMICFGIDSGSQRILDLMKKGTRVEQNFEAIKTAQSSGLNVMGYFIAGFPGETRETIRQSIDFIEKSNIDQAQFYTFIPLPGNEVYKNPEKFGVTKMSKDYKDYFHVTGKDGRGGRVIETKHLTSDELHGEVVEIRKFLKSHTWRGDVQDYYKKDLGYNVE
ncbi:MAG TPA: B12-binding domain-containing radical SAM protein [bacterium]|nr:B12-binding domain-containing radical SAM protein [bacterium]